MDKRLYRAVRNIPIKGHQDGRPVVATISEGSIAIPVRTASGDEAVLVEGAVIPVAWGSQFFSFMFVEA